MKTLKIISLVALAWGLIGQAHAGKLPPLVPIAASTPVSIQSELAYPIVSQHFPRSNYLKVSLTGGYLSRHFERSPINLSLVIDRSGSMKGQKIEKAREAALLAVDMLRENDIISIIGYDSSAKVIVPATRLTDKHALKQRIRDAVRANGNTALFAGVAKGIHETKKFLSNNKVNRVILLSDGQANVGPSSSSELGELGIAAAKQGIAVTTIGLGEGYNEDLMTTLAGYSDGNHAFVENAGDLELAFNREFNDVMNVVAQQVNVEITVKNGKPLRLYGREGKIRGNRVNVRLNQIYANQEKYILLELAPGTYRKSGDAQTADIRVSYFDNATERRVNDRQSIDVVYTQSQTVAERAVNEAVLADFFVQQSNYANELAIQALDAGDTAEANAILNRAQQKITSQSKSFATPAAKAKVQSQSKELSNLAQEVQAAPKVKVRKLLKEKNYQIKKQQKQ